MNQGVTTQFWIWEEYFLVRLDFRVVIMNHDEFQLDYSI